VQVRGVNIIYFFTVQGFFIGMFFALFRAGSPLGILYYTFMITGFFYLFSHLFVAFYFRSMTVKSALFPKESHEQELDRFMHEIDRREQRIVPKPKMEKMAMTGDAR